MEFEKGMDVDVGKLVCYRFYDDELTQGPNHPPFRLRSLVAAAYASYRDSGSDSSGSGHKSNAECSPEEWSQFFTEDGHLRFDHIISLLPPHQMTEYSLSNYELTFDYFKLAVSSYNINQGTEYELVAPLLITGLFSADYYVVYHANFIAKLKNASDSPFELFFAEVVPIKVEPGQERVIKCTILTPHTSGSRDCITYQPCTVLHPEDLKCGGCLPDLNKYDGDTDSDSDGI